MARMANNCSARAPRSSHRHGSAKAIFAPSAQLQCGWQRGAKMTVKSCGSHFVMIFTLCSREACWRCRAAKQHLEYSVCAIHALVGRDSAYRPTHHWSVGAIPTDQNSLVGRDITACRSRLAAAAAMPRDNGAAITTQRQRRSDNGAATMAKVDVHMLAHDYFKFALSS